MAVTIFDLSAILRLDKSQYDRGLDEAESEATKKGNKIGSALGAIGKVGAVALTASFAAVSSIVKKSISEYAEYEQLWGGVQKLYGTAGKSIEEYASSVGKSVDSVRVEYRNLEEAQRLMLKQANEGYKTAGISANEYMKQATSFSAALINSLNGDTVKAAQQTDVAMRAISDNFNTFGGDIGMLSYTFQGFAKQNYTMLDNLKLGYGGTKSEMERLIADANEYAKSMGKASNLSIDSFSDVVTAIDLIQQKQGIAGTTAREAATTISGSIGMLKGAWENLLAGIANKDADLNQLMNNVVDSAKIVVSNLLPVFDTAITGILRLLNDVAPLVGKELPSLLEKIVPPILEATWKLFVGLVQAIPQLFAALAKIIPQLAKIVIDSLKKVFGEITNPKFIKDTIKNIELSFKTYVKYFTDLAKISFTEGKKIAENIKKGYETVAPKVISTFSDFYNKIKTFINENGAQTWQVVLDNVKNFLLNINTILAGFIETVVNFIVNHGFEILTAVQSILSVLAEALLSFIPVIFSAIGDLLTKIQEIFLNVDWIGLAIKVFDFIINTIKMQAENLFMLVGIIIQTISTTLVTTDWMGIISKIFELLIGAITVFIPHVFQKMIELANSMISALLSIDWLGLGITVITAIANGLYNTFGLIPAILLEIGRTAVDFVTSIDWLGLGIKIINFIVGGIQALFSSIPSILRNIAQTAVNFVTSIDWIGLGMKIINFIRNGIQALFEALPTIIKTIASLMVSTVLAIDWLGLGTKLITFIGNGIKSLASSIPDQLKQIGQKAFNAFKNINWIDLGRNIIDGIVSGITGFAHKIYDKMSSIAKSALEKAESVLKIGSPSKEFRDRVGKYIPLGIAAGIEQNEKAVRDALDHLNMIPDTYDFSRSLVGDFEKSATIDVNDKKSAFGDTYIININREIATADEIARAIRTESQYGLLGGGSLG